MRIKIFLDLIEKYPKDETNPETKHIELDADDDVIQCLGARFLKCDPSDLDKEDVILYEERTWIIKETSLQVGGTDIVSE